MSMLRQRILVKAPEEITRAHLSLLFSGLWHRDFKYVSSLNIGYMVIDKHSLLFLAQVVSWGCG